MHSGGMFASVKHSNFVSDTVLDRGAEPVSCRKYTKQRGQGTICASTESCFGLEEFQKGGQR